LNLYLALVVLLALTAQFSFFIEKKYSQINYVLWVTIFIVIVLFVGLRFNSVDYFSYYELYHRQGFFHFGFPFYTGAGQTTGNEFLFASLVSLFRYFNASFYYFVFFFAFVSLSVKFYVFFKYSKYFFLSFFIYFCLLISKDLGQIRLAATFGFIGLAAISSEKREFWKFVFYIFIAAAIQAASVIFIPLYVFYSLFKIKIFRYIYLLVCILLYKLEIVSTVLLRLSGLSDNLLLQKFESYYALQSGMNVGFNFFNIVITVFGLFLLLIVDRGARLGIRFFEGFVCLYSYSVGLYWVFLAVPTISSRILEAGALFSLSMILPYLLGFLKGRLEKFLIFNVVVMIFLVYFLFFSLENINAYESIL